MCLFYLVHLVGEELRKLGGLFQSHSDEMGLGKTVEVLACIFAYRKSALEVGHVFEDIMQVSRDQKNNIKRMKWERVECVCGAVSESSKCEGLWVQCDICDAWQHADCVGYSAMDKTSKSREVSKDKGSGKKLTGSSQKLKTSKRNSKNSSYGGGSYLCAEG